MLFKSAAQRISSCLAIYQESSAHPAPLLNEPTSPLTEKWTELEWQALWYSGAFGTTFQSTNGAVVEIIQFGFWNREPGPDFVHAAIRVDGEHAIEGDIEWDMHVADWERHGHAENPAFDQVKVSATCLGLFIIVHRTPIKAALSIAKYYYKSKWTAIDTTSSVTSGGNHQEARL